MTKTCVTAAGLYCGMGVMVPIAPTIAAMAAVILVRCILWSKDESLKWNIAVCGLAMLASFATIEGTSTSTFFGFWMGVGYGGLGVGIVALGKNMATGLIKERFGKAIEAFLGTKTKTD